MQSWSYALFFTLTYSEDTVPTVEFVDGSFRQVHNRRQFDFDLEMPDMASLDLTKKDVQYLARRDGRFFCLSRKDIELFMKRYRINIKRYGNEKETVRYFICGEYGPTTLRPHYHGIFFFNSKWQAENARKMLLKAWPLGFVDLSFIQRDAASYVAKYLNCTTHLPAFCAAHAFKPFASFSRHPPIGTLPVMQKEIRDVVFGEALELSISSDGGKTYRSTPIWSTYEYQLFPKLSKFSSISHDERVTFYRWAAEQTTFSTPKELVDYVQFNLSSQGRVSRQNLIPKYIARYIIDISDGGARDSAITRYFYCGRRVAANCLVFNTDIKTYISRIEAYYQRRDMRNLKSQLQAEQQAVDELHPLDALFKDRIRLDYLLSDLGCTNINNLLPSDILLLESYGVDLELFFTDTKYRANFEIERTRMYQSYKLHNDVIIEHSRKTKKKNDYLLFLDEEANNHFSFLFCGNAQ